jgi:hypothetical protein
VRSDNEGRGFRLAGGVFMASGATSSSLAWDTVSSSSADTDTFFVLVI